MYPENNKLINFRFFPPQIHKTSTGNKMLQLQYLLYEIKTKYSTLTKIF